MFKYVKSYNMLNDDEDKREFNKIIIENNVNRCNKIAEYLLYINLVLILVDLSLYKQLRNSVPAYTYLYYSHIIICILFILWLIGFRFLKVYKKKPNYKLMIYVFINIIMYWCVFMGLNSIKISGHITAYMVCLMGLSIIFYLSPIESFIIYSISFIIFIIGLIFIVSDTKYLYSQIINTTFVILTAFFASNLNYYSMLKDFINNKTILKSKKEIELSNIKLKEYEKLRTDFFANISHEFRTPLNIIFCAYQMIDFLNKSGNYEKDKMDKYLKMIKQNVYRLTRLINNLIDITKIDATLFEIKPINCNVVEIIEDITNSVADYIQDKGISLEFDTDIEEKIIACDPDKIERVMLNLLSNAVKFTPKGGKIFVSVYLQDNNVNISVKDTGIGIEDKMKELIFERFIQADKSISRNSEGSGIGLSLVKSLVELQNGKITLNSTYGQGSEFIISLPDIKINNEGQHDCFVNKEQRIERINIEFSDIYE